MNFGWAIEQLKAGDKVTRKGWNGKGMYLWLMPATTVKAEWCKEPVLKRLAEENGGEIECLGTIRMYTHDSTGRKAVLTGWLASQSDMLAEDWDYACVSPEDEQRSCCCSSSIDKLPKAGSMENCEILCNTINQLLDKVNKMPQLHATMQPGPNDKELTVTIVEEEPDERIAMTLNVTEVCREAIGCRVVNLDGITKASIGSPLENTEIVAGDCKVEDVYPNFDKEG